MINISLCPPCLSASVRGLLRFPYACTIRTFCCGKGMCPQKAPWITSISAAQNLPGFCNILVCVSLPFWFLPALPVLSCKAVRPVQAGVGNSYANFLFSSFNSAVDYVYGFVAVYADKPLVYGVYA